MESSRIPPLRMAAASLGIDSNGSCRILNIRSGLWLSSHQAKPDPNYCMVPKERLSRIEQDAWRGAFVSRIRPGRIVDAKRTLRGDPSRRRGLPFKYPLESHSDQGAHHGRRQGRSKSCGSHRAPDPAQVNAPGSSRRRNRGRPKSCKGDIPAHGNGTVRAGVPRAGRRT